MTRLTILLLAGGLLTGCSNLHHVEVGAIPDDYRTRHPIVVAEGEHAIEIPVVSSDTGLTRSAQSRVEEFTRRFRASDAAAIRIMVPAGAWNEASARLAADEAVKVITRGGVPRDRVIVTPYPAAGVEGPVPIRLGFSTLTASVAPCGRWPQDLGNSHENKNYFNFGCASQANLAAQIADPRDLLAPRGMSETDAQRRTTVVSDYRTGASTASARESTESDYNW